ncbi:MAG: hypothetical protein JSV85_03725 [Candidatus Bathyarchaeota archaeon]|nr:MAG: hypothetical protein JSV85_03725 [Candidatus Bathyarchaeota archaeon]
MQRFNSKKIVFIATMSALGNVLAGISIYLGPIYPGVALDLSHIATFIAAIYGGPAIGFLVGLFGGVFSGVYFGPLGTLSWLGLIGLPLGKSLTGLTTGALHKLFRVKQRSHPSIITLPLVISSYVPECLFTIFFFLSIMPYFLGLGGGLFMLGFILPKAWGEIILMSFLMAALVGNEGFSVFIASALSVYKTRSRP